MRTVFLLLNVAEMWPSFTLQPDHRRRRHVKICLLTTSIKDYHSGERGVEPDTLLQ